MESLGICEMFLKREQGKTLTLLSSFVITLKTAKQKAHTYLPLVIKAIYGSLKHATGKQGHACIVNGFKQSSSSTMQHAG